MYHDIETVIGRIDIIIIVTVSIVIYWYIVLALQRRDFSVFSLGRKCWVGKMYIYRKIKTLLSKDSQSQMG